MKKILCILMINLAVFLGALPERLLANLDSSGKAHTQGDYPDPVGSNADDSLITEFDTNHATRRWYKPVSWFKEDKDR